VLEVVELDDRLAPVGMLPTDPAWLRLMELLSFRPGRWWNTIFGMAFLAVVVVGAAVAAVVVIGTLLPGSRWVAGGGCHGVPTSTAATDCMSVPAARSAECR
jgi:hypothetical protein